MKEAPCWTSAEISPAAPCPHADRRPRTVTSDKELKTHSKTSNNSNTYHETHKSKAYMKDIEGLHKAHPSFNSLHYLAQCEHVWVTSLNPSTC